MKLLFCDKCDDLFKLGFELRSCSCGYVKGKYIDSLNAEVNGNGYSLAIGNGSLTDAMYNFDKTNPNLTRDFFVKNNKIEYCWIRPHEGQGNPHTKINPNL